jgi:hypothetical protein
VYKRPASGLGRTAGLKKSVKKSSWGSPRGSVVYPQWGTLCEGTTSHKLCERDKGKFKQGENALLRELFKGTVALFAVKRTFV